MLQDSLSLLREPLVHILQHLHLPRALRPLSPHGARSQCPRLPLRKGTSAAPSETEESAAVARN